jgi:hypothetical protein
MTLGAIVVPYGFFRTLSFKREVAFSSFGARVRRAILKKCPRSVPKTGANDGERQRRDKQQKSLRLNDFCERGQTMAKIRDSFAMPFHGGNRGSNPLGDANKIKYLASSAVTGVPVPGRGRIRPPRASGALR